MTYCHIKNIAQIITTNNVKIIMKFQKSYYNQSRIVNIKHNNVNGIFKNSNTREG